MCMDQALHLYKNVAQINARVLFLYMQADCGYSPKSLYFIERRLTLIDEEFA